MTNEYKVLATGRRIVVASALLVAVSSAHAQDGTPAQRSACTPDVFRLCAIFIPDHAAIISCLESNRSNLAPACQAEFSRKSTVFARKSR